MTASQLRPLAEINADAKPLIAGVLDRVDIAHAHRDRQAVRLGDIAFASRRAEAFGLRENVCRTLAQLLLCVAELG